jgi:hypothetical protein
VNADIVHRYEKQLEAVKKKQTLLETPPKRLTGTPQFFNHTSGEPLCWYYEDVDGAIELYDKPGFHPRFREELRAITSEVANKYEKQEEEKQRKAQEDERRRAEAERRQTKLAEQKRLAELRKQEDEEAQRWVEELQRRYKDPFYKDSFDKGMAPKGAIGAPISNITPEQAQSWGLALPQGALVSNVHPGEPAALAGIQRGDIIMEYNGHPIQEVSKLVGLVALTQPGRTVPLKVLRQGKEKTFSVTIAPYDMQKAKADAEERNKLNQQLKYQKEQMAYEIKRLTDWLNLEKSKTEFEFKDKIEKLEKRAVYYGKNQDYYEGMRRAHELKKLNEKKIDDIQNQIKSTKEKYYNLY